MKITGQILKENREKRGITINEVALATKISSKALIAIEEGDVDRLPPKTFLRGFVLAYATYLKINTDTVLSTFYEEMGSTKPKPHLNEPEDSAAPQDAPRPAASSTQPSSPKKSQVKMDGEGIQIGTPSSKFFLLTGVALLIIAIIVIKRKMDSYNQEAQRALEVAKITAPTAVSPEPIPHASPTPEGTSDSVVGAAKTSTPETATQNSPGTGGQADAAKPMNSVIAAPNLAAESSSTNKTPPPSVPRTTPTPPAVAVAPANPNSIPTTSQPVTNKPTIANASATSKPAPGEATTATSNPSATPAPTVAATTPPTPTVKSTPSAKPTGKTQEVIIEALNNVEIEAILEGEAPKKFTLKAEQVQTIKAKGKVILKLNDGGAVNITNNGIDRGVPGDLGKATKVEYP